MRVVGQKLDEITSKLDAMTKAIAGLVDEIKQTGEGLVGGIAKLTEILEKDIEIVTQRSKEGFDESRSQLMAVTREMDTLRRVTGTDQMLRVNNALNQLLSLLSNAIDPNKIQQQLFEISQFIKSYGGSK